MRLAVLSLATLALAACGTRSTYRYEMTVEVETPQGLRSGSAVREIAYSGEDCWFCLFFESNPQLGLRGEAVIVDLPRGQTLFALLKGAEGEADYGERIADRAMGKSYFVELYPTHPPTAKLARTSAVPMLATFRDVRDPISIELVDPRDLAKSLGAGVRLRRITLGFTNKPVTTSIERRLSWLEAVGRQRGALAPGDALLVSQTLLVNQVGSGDFSTELFDETRR